MKKKLNRTKFKRKVLILVGMMILFGTVEATAVSLVKQSISAEVR